MFIEVLSNLKKLETNKIDVFLSPLLLSTFHSIGLVLQGVYTQNHLHKWAPGAKDKSKGDYKVVLYELK